MHRFLNSMLLALVMAGCTDGTLDGEMADAQVADSSTGSPDATTAPPRDGSAPSDAAPPVTESDGGRDGAVASAMCSGAEGTVGVNSCEYVPDITLYDCEGNPVALHSLCGTEISYVYTYAHWCPNCISFATNKANDFYAEYQESVGDFEMYFVITETERRERPDAAFCQRVRDQYGLTMPVLFDRDGLTNSVLGMRENTADLVMRRGGLIVVNGPWAEFTVRTAIEGGYGECCTTC